MKRALCWVAVFAACSAPKPLVPVERPDEPVGEMRAKQPELAIGLFTSMSGAHAELGAAMVNGVQMAVAERNDAGGVLGHRVTLATRDDQSEFSNVEQLVNQLIDAEHAVGILGGTTMEAASAGAWIAERRGVPMIAPTSTSGRLRDIGGMVYGAALTDRAQGVAAAKFLVQSIGARRIAVMFDSTSPYSTDAATAVELEVPKLGGQIMTAQPYTPAHPLQRLIKGIHATNPDAVFVGDDQQTRYVTKSVKVRLDVPFIGPEGWYSRGLLPLDIDGAYVCTQFTALATDPRIVRFVRDYRHRFRGHPNGVAALSYDATRILLDAIVRAGSLDAVDIATEIARTTEFPGVTGTTTFDGLRDTVKPAMIVQLRDGTFRFVTTIDT
ncbi:MAG: ABC transporter substrate-binding protein [Kofleriaceae bacterium]